MKWLVCCSLKKDVQVFSIIILILAKKTLVIVCKSHWTPTELLISLVPRILWLILYCYHLMYSYLTGNSEVIEDTRGCSSMYASSLCLKMST